MLTKIHCDTAPRADGDDLSPCLTGVPTTRLHSGHSCENKKETKSQA